MSADNSAVLIPSHDNDDYIDLIDVLGFLWRARFWAAIGLLISMAFSSFFIMPKKRAVYITSIPVTLDLNGYASPDEVSSKFNTFANSAELRLRLIERVGDAAVEKGLSPLELVKSDGGWILRVFSARSDPSGNLALEMAKIANDLARETNSKIQADKTQRSVIISKNAGVEIRFAEVAKRQAEEEAPLLLKLFTIESELAQKAAIRAMPSKISGSAYLGNDIIRLLASLEGKISDEEKQRVLSDYAFVTGKMRAIQAKYEAPLNELKVGLGKNSNDIIAESLSSLRIIPLLRVDEIGSKESKTFWPTESYDSKTKFFFVIAAFIGVLVGVMCFRLKTYFIQNRQRFRAIFSNS